MFVGACQPLCESVSVRARETPGTRANQSVCLCPLTVFVCVCARCRKRMHLALESVCFGLCAVEQM